MRLIFNNYKVPVTSHCGFLVKIVIFTLSVVLNFWNKHGQKVPDLYYFYKYRNHLFKLALKRNIITPTINRYNQFNAPHTISKSASSYPEISTDIVRIKSNKSRLHCIWATRYVTATTHCLAKLKVTLASILGVKYER